jgi:hypothetical protein
MNGRVERSGGERFQGWLRFKVTVIAGVFVMKEGGSGFGVVVGPFHVVRLRGHRVKDGVNAMPGGLEQARQQQEPKSARGRLSGTSASAGTTLFVRSMIHRRPLHISIFCDSVGTEHPTLPHRRARVVRRSEDQILAWCHKRPSGGEGECDPSQAALQSQMGLQRAANRGHDEMHRTGARVAGCDPHPETGEQR